MPNIDISDDITDVIPDGGTAGVTDDSTPDQPIDSDVDDDAERNPDDYDHTDAEDMGDGGDPIPPDSTPPAEELPEPVPVAREIMQSEFITDYSAANLAEYEQSGAVPYAVYDDGTERQVAWADVSDPSPAPEAVVSEAAEVAAATNQHFWQNSTDSATYGGAGVHVTDDEKDAWVQAVAAGFPDIETKPWHNTLINSLGILLRTGLRNLVSITKSAIAFFDGKGNEAKNIVARFGSDGAQIGLTDESHLTLNYHSMQMVDKEGSAYFHVSDLRDRSGINSYTVKLQPSLSHAAGELMTIGAVYDIDSFAGECTVLFDGEPYTGTVEPIYDDPNGYFASVFGWRPIVGVTVGESVTGQYDRWTMLVEAENPFEIAFTFGERNPDKITAGGSSVFGSYCEASGFNSFATGMTTKAIGAFSRADGIASTSRGLCAEASGRESTATGDYSHAQNIGTKASSDSQTVIGKYNIEDNDDTYALIVGNGSDGSNRSNALTVKWNGDVDMGETQHLRSTTVEDATAVPSANQGVTNRFDYDGSGNRVGYSQIFRTPTGVYRSFAVTNPTTGNSAALYLNSQDDGTRTVDMTGGVAWPVKNGGTGATSAAGARTNLGLGSLATKDSVGITRQWASATSSKQTLNAGAGKEISIPCPTPSGYVLSGIVDCNTNHNLAGTIGGFRYSGGTAYVSVTNRSSSQWTDLTVTVYYACIKADVS